MKRVIILILAIAAATAAFSQEQDDKPKTVYHHMIRASLSFAPGFMLNGTNNVYISGTLEYYLADHLSITGTSFYFLNSRNNTYPELKMNHQVYTGFQYHILKDRAFDPYIGLEPGIAISQTRDAYPLDVNVPVLMTPVENTTVGANPMLSFDAGFNIYAVKFFHLFVNGRYVTGRYLGGPNPYSLNEITVSFGLGLNANFWNMKKK